MRARPGRPLLLLLAPALLLAAACGQKSGVAGTGEPAAPGTASPPATRARSRYRSWVDPAKWYRGVDDARGRDGGTDDRGAADDGDGGGTVRARRRRHRRGHRRRDRDRHPRARHRRLAHPPDELRRRQGHLLGVAGRERPRALRPNVRVVFRDDEFNPQNAVQVCREMVEEEGAFLLVGGGGADQITACAQYASEAGIPYLSAGVNETGLSDLDTYFATSLTYAEQAPLIIAQLQDQGFTEAALVVGDTPSFDDAYDALKSAADDAGLTSRTRPGSTRTAAEPATLGGPGAEELRRRSGDPAQLTGRVRRARQPGSQPELHADVDRSRHHQRAQRRHHCRVPERRHRRVLLAEPGPRRDQRARPRLRTGLRAVRRRRPRRTTSGSSCGR